MAKISVIVPVYGVEKYLKECVDSILAQTLTDIEVLLIDDGGKDGCPEMIDEYAKQDSRVVAIHKDNGGYGHTCNVGLERATGEYISIIEPDDYIDKNMYEELYAQALKDNSDIVKSAYIANYLGEDRPRQVYSPDNKEFVKPDKVFTLKEYPAFMLIHPSVWSCIYKKDFLAQNNIKFKEASGAGWTDNPFQVQTMCLAERISYVDRAYYYWRLFKWDDLRDISLPFVRSVEIHNWLKENNIDDDAILSYLYKRECVYLGIVHRLLKLSEIAKYKELMGSYIDSLDYDLIERSTILKNREKKLFKALRKCSCCVVCKEKLKLFKSNIFKFRFNDKEKFLYLLGCCVWRGK